MPVFPHVTMAKRAKCMIFLSFLNFNFICELVLYFKSFLRIWHNQVKSCRSNRLKFSRIPVQAIPDLLTSPNFYRPWTGGLESEPLVCFSDATPSRVAFV